MLAKFVGQQEVVVGVKRGEDAVGGCFTHKELWILVVLLDWVCGVVVTAAR